MFRQIKNTLIPCDFLQAQASGEPYTGVFTESEWQEYAGSFPTGLSVAYPQEMITETWIDVGTDCLTGTFHIPQYYQQNNEYNSFCFVMDAKRIFFIDNTGTAERITAEIAAARKWKQPSLERFLYDFLESLTAQDSRSLQEYEKKLAAVEKILMEKNPGKEELLIINNIRGELLDLKDYYEQLIDLSQELEENENEFFQEGNLRYFHLFTTRTERLRDRVASLREYTIQLRDLYQTQLDIRQNRLMAVLTILTTIFFPLTLITGWYGMNFVYMPELHLQSAYPVLIAVCILIVSSEIYWFRKKKYW